MKTDDSTTRPTSGARGLFCAALAVGGLFIGGCGGDEKPVAETIVELDVVAEIGDARISVADFENELKRLQSKRRAVDDRKAVLDQMISREAMLQRAVGSGLADDPDVRRELDNLLLAKLWEREFEPDAESVTVTDAELRAEYERRRETEFTRPAKVRLAILKLNADPKMSGERKAELREKLAGARARTLAEPPTRGRGPAALGFGRIAINFSEDQVSRYRGGDIGWFVEGDLENHVPREVLTAGYALKKKEISGIIETASGYYLVTKTDSRPANVVSFEKAALVLKQGLMVKKKQALRQQFLDVAREIAGVTIHTDRLERVKLPVPDRKMVSREAGLAGPDVPGIRVEEK